MTISQFDYKNYHFIYSANLESYETGTLTFDLDFSSTPSDELVLITCCVYERTAEVDNFRNVKIIYILYASDRATNVYICDPLGILSTGLPP